MVESSQKKLLIIAIILQLPLLLIVATGGGSETGDLTGLIGFNAAFDAFYIIVLSPLIMIFFIEFFSILLAYGYFKFHNLMKLKRFDYAIFKFDDVKLSNKQIVSRAILLGLFAFSIGTLITEYIDHQIIAATGFEDTSLSLVIMISTLVIIPYLILILVPIWLMRDSGVICSKKTFKGGQNNLPDIEGVYRDYNSIVTGYIGISAIIALIFLIHTDIIELIGTGDEGMFILIIIAPLMGIGVSIIPLMFYNWRLAKLREKFIKKLTSKGLKIVDNINDI